MRRLRAVWMAGAAFAVAVAVSPCAQAQMAVIDSANLAQTSLTAARAMSQLRQLIAQYNQLAATYRMFTSPTDVTSLAPGLGTPFARNPLPATNLLDGLIDGASAATGAGVSFYKQNHVYTPTDGTAASQALIANGNAIANIEGIAAANLQSVEQRLAQLPGLEADLSAATSITQVNAINGRIALEANYAQAQQVQAQNLALLAREREASERQQEKERFVKDMTNGETDMMAAATANGGQ